jgi:hypothetical protein
VFKGLIRFYLVTDLEGLRNPVNEFLNNVLLEDIIKVNTDNVQNTSASTEYIVVVVLKEKVQSYTHIDD